MWHSIALGVDHDFSRVFTPVSNALSATMGGLDGDAMTMCHAHQADSHDMAVSRMTFESGMQHDKPPSQSNEPDRVRWRLACLGLHLLPANAQKQGMARTLTGSNQNRPVLDLECTGHRA